MDQNAQKGVTLIELMITIAVLAVIAAIAIPAYTGYITTAKKSECFNEMSAIKLSEEEYFLENNTFFSGVRNSGTVDGLKNNSSGYYSNVYSAEDNCSYSVVAGPTGDMTSYVLTASGINELAGEGTIGTFTKQ